MKWFVGEVSEAVQKAIQERKVFVVFIRDENEESSKMEELWNDEEVTNICSEEKCVAINILSESVPGKQFGAIYPVLIVPSTYLINNQGTPTDIIPGISTKEEFTIRLQEGIQNALAPPSPPSQPSQEDKSEEVPSTSSSGNVEKEPITSAEPTDNVEKEPITSVEPDNVEKEPIPSEEPKEVSEDNLESELSSSEKAMMSRLHEKYKTKKEKEQQKRELQDAQCKIAEIQAKRLAAEIAVRKAEDNAAREKVREKIRLDRLEKNKRFDREKAEREVLRKQAESTKKEVETKKVDSNTARIQFRLPNGSSVANEFNADAKFLLADGFVKEHLQSSNIRLTTVYPRHEFDSEDMQKSFRDLGLVPNASIIVSPGPSAVSSTSAFDPMAFIKYVFSLLFSVFSWIGSFFTASSSSETQSTSQSPQPTVSPPRNNDVRRRNVQPPRSSNMQRLWKDEDKDDATWNGNSTQQM